MKSLKPNCRVKINYEGRVKEENIKAEGIWVGQKNGEHFVEINKLVFKFPRKSITPITDKPRIVPATSLENLAKEEAVRTMISGVDGVPAEELIQLYKDLVSEEVSIADQEVWQPFEDYNREELIERLESFYNQFVAFGQAVMKRVPRKKGAK